MATHPHHLSPASQLADIKGLLATHFPECEINGTTTIQVIVTCPSLYTASLVGLFYIDKGWVVNIKKSNFNQIFFITITLNQVTR